MHIAPGPWPVTLTPFADDGTPDLDAVDRYARWLIGRGAAGLFAVALSGEMYELSAEERVAVAARTVTSAAGRVPVIAAALGDGTIDGLRVEVSALAAAGVDAVVLVVPTILRPDDDEDVLFATVDALLAAHPTVDFGIYECPLPHHRLLSLAAVERLARTGRFVFFKETSHDIEVMRERARVAAPIGLRIFNAGIENYAESLDAGVAGLSGWVVNVAPDLVARVGALTASGAHEAAARLQGILVDVEQRMGPTYPGSAKAIVDARSGVGLGTRSRWRPADVDDALVSALAARLDEA